MLFLAIITGILNRELIGMEQKMPYSVIWRYQFNRTESVDIFYGANYGGGEMRGGGRGDKKTGLLRRLKIPLPVPCTPGSYLFVHFSIVKYHAMF